MSIEKEFIKAYCETDEDLYWVCQSYKNKEEATPFLKSTILLRESLAVGGNPEFALKLASRYAPNDNTHKDLIILKKALQANVAYLLRNITEAQIHLKDGQNMVTEETVPEIKAYLEWIDIVVRINDHETFQKSFKEFFEKLSLVGPRINHYKLVQCLDATYKGQAKTQLTNLLSLAVSERFKQTVIRFLFINAMENGNREEAIRHFQVFSKMKYFFIEDNSINNTFEKFALLLDFYLKALSNETSNYEPVGFQAKSIERMGTNNYPTWLLMAKSLLENKPQEALYWARLEQRDAFHYRSTGFFQLNVLRAELSNRNIESAENEIKRITQISSDIPILAFFKARLAFLLDRESEAASHLNELGEYLDKNQAWGRLNLELLLANELKPMTILRMGQFLANKNLTIDSSKPTIPNIRLPMKPLVLMDKIIGESAAIKNVKTQIDKSKDLEMTILITGETGTGKELIAECIHECSQRSKEPFLKINCAAVSETLLESELFGHEKGAFTGASNERKGLFEEAGNGTVFLDEIGDVSPRIQTALLRVLESSEIKPLGSNFTKKIHCRVITATNVNLAEMSKLQKFRQDLYYRLYRLPIHSPALRDRKEDIPLLASYFANLIVPSQNSPEFSSDLKEAIMKYRWPGNIRELKNEIERMVLMNINKKVLGLEDLDLNIRLQMGLDIQPKIKDVIPDAAISKPQYDQTQIFANAMRRIEFIKQLFVQKTNLTRPEIAKATNTSTFTTTRDLKQLLQENFIIKITPTPAPRTHYFRLKP
jgi:DNA-binding NtrC family response regulator